MRRDFVSTIANVPLKARVPVVLFQHNVEYVIWKRLKEVENKAWRRAVLEIEWRKMRRYEAKACRESAVTLAVSDVDRDILLKEAPAAKVYSIPTGVDINYFKPNGTGELPTELVLTGSMDWYPNEDGILALLDATLPLIRREIPNVESPSSGAIHRTFARRRESPGDVTGTVEDVRPFVTHSAVYVVPLRWRRYADEDFEALAMGKAVVSTTVVRRGSSH